jgi:DNA-binding MarR family transcriptional regulator
MTSAKIGYPETIEVRDSCLCMHVQHGARALARTFDAAFRPLRLTHGQFSLLMSLNRPQPPTLSSVAELLGMDRTSLTAKLKPLERRKLVKSLKDRADQRNRFLALTEAGQGLLARAYPIWKSTHARLDGMIPAQDQKRLKQQMLALGQDS